MDLSDPMNRLKDIYLKKSELVIVFLTLLTLGTKPAIKIIVFLGSSDPSEELLRSLKIEEKHTFF